MGGFIGEIMDDVRGSVRHDCGEKHIHRCEPRQFEGTAGPVGAETIWWFNQCIEVLGGREKNRLESREGEAASRPAIPGGEQDTRPKIPERRQVESREGEEEGCRGGEEDNRPVRPQVEGDSRPKEESRGRRVQGEGESRAKEECRGG